MKKPIYLLLVLGSIVISIISCKDMDSLYKDFVIQNDLKYPQKADSVKIYPGYHKLHISWLKPKDPTVIRAEVYWNNYQDTLKIDIPKDQDSIAVDINDLEEGTYTLYIKTFDKENNASVISEITGNSYGDEYILATSDRDIKSAQRDKNNKGTLIWSNKTPDLIYSEVRYKTLSGQIKTLQISSNENTLFCPNIKPGEPFEYRSVFLPQNGIDTIVKEWTRFDNPFLYKYPRENWSVNARNGNHDWGDGGGGQPSLILDGNMNTGWHSAVGTPLPQCIVVDMKESLFVNNIILYPPEKTNWRYIQNVEIYISENPIIPDVPSPSWGEPVAKELYSGEDNFIINLPKSIEGRYIAVVFLDSKSSPDTFISVMELEVFGY